MVAVCTGPQSDCAPLEELYPEFSSWRRGGNAVGESILPNFFVGQNHTHGNSHNKASCWLLELLGISTSTTSYSLGVPKVEVTPHLASSGITADFVIWWLFGIS
jgi:hypothetical protein